MLRLQELKKDANLFRLAVSVRNENVTADRSRHSSYYRAFHAKPFSSAIMDRRHPCLINPHPVDLAGGDAAVAIVTGSKRRAGLAAYIVIS